MDPVMSLSRRAFVSGVAAISAASLGLTALGACAPLPPGSNRPTRIARLGFLVSARNQAAYLEGLADLGYFEGQNIALEWRSADGQQELLPQFAEELVRLPVDVLVAEATPAAQAAKQATSTIPIVFTLINDPVAQGLVTGLARPGGNLTGLSTLSGVLTGKRLELLKATLVGLSRVAAFWNAANAGQVLAFNDLTTAAVTLGLQLVSYPLRTPEDIAPALEAARREHLDAFVVLPATSTPLARPTIFLEFAAQEHLPALHSTREDAQAGGLMALQPDYAAMRRRAATYVDKILKGSSPADLPIEQPTAFDFIVNSRAAAVLGITFPPDVAAQVTEWVQ
jgi:ABC-type uncharacterized transport system substrate-binding protein